MVRHGAGLDFIAIPAATERGVLVANISGANAIIVAEHAIWSAMALLRQYPVVNNDLCADGWEADRRHSNNGLELSGKTIGIVGYGNVGKALAQIARHGFSARVLVQTRTPREMPDGIIAASFNSLFSASDVVVSCCPLTDQTRGLISADAIAHMKLCTVLVNVARGAVVKEIALVDALQSGAYVALP